MSYCYQCAWLMPELDVANKRIEDQIQLQLHHLKSLSNYHIEVETLKEERDALKARVAELENKS